MTDTAPLTTPTPEEYVAAHRNDAEELRFIHRLYERNAARDPRPEWRLKWSALLARFNAELYRRRLVL